jgi:HEPN domain-containing protein
MPGHSQTMQVVREWIVKAENDLTNAVHTLKLKEKCPTDTVCFHAQQAVEKYFKALLVYRDIDFKKTHDISELAGLLPKSLHTGMSVAEQELLTDYATVTRYPGDYEPIPLAEARKAVTIVRRFRKQIRALLPKEALRIKN